MKITDSPWDGIKPGDYFQAKKCQYCLHPVVSIRKPELPSTTSTIWSNGTQPVRAESPLTTKVRYIVQCLNLCKLPGSIKERQIQMLNFLHNHSCAMWSTIPGADKKEVHCLQRILNCIYYKLITIEPTKKLSTFHNHHDSWLSGKESTCLFRRCRFNPWFGKIPWRRK